jgi:3-keto-5-aminohexanoate cleavage enzyme
VRRLPENAVWQVVGIGRANLVLTAIGLAIGGNARTGLEDTLLIRRGEPAAGNGPLVERLATVARSIEREPASLAEACELLGVGGRGAA